VQHLGVDAVRCWCAAEPRHRVAFHGLVPFEFWLPD
jgi:hypothetical protein